MIMIEIEFNNQSGFSVSFETIKKTVNDTIKSLDSRYDFLRNKKIAISLAAVESVAIRKFNKAYRKKDKTTDVLSFSFYKNISDLKKETGKKIFLGELVFCCEYIKKSATMNKTPFNKELAYIISHGTLHLLGMRHGKSMFSIQDGVSGQNRYGGTSK